MPAPFVEDSAEGPMWPSDSVEYSAVSGAEAAGADTLTGFLSYGECERDSVVCVPSGLCWLLSPTMLIVVVPVVLI